MPDLNETLQSALRLHQGGNLAQAEEGYREILLTDPGHADAQHLLGLIQFQRGDLNSALASIGRAIQLNSAQAMFHNHLGQVYRAVGNSPQAEVCCRDALRIDPGFAEAHNTLGALFSDRGDFSQAVPCFRQAIELKPDFSEAHANLGRALREVGQIDQAMDSFRRALAYDPQQIGALYELGRLLLMRGQWEEAKASLERVIAIKPDHAESHHDLACVYKGQGNLAQAEDSYLRALQYRWDLPEAHFNLGVIWQARGELTEAEDAYRIAIRIKGDYSHAHNNLGGLLIAQNNLPDALASFQASAKSDPRSAEPQLNLANTYVKLQKLELAEACLRRAIELNPRMPQAHNMLGNLLLRQNRCEEALVCYNGAVELRGDYVEAHRNRAWALLKLGNFAQGWPEFEWRLRLPDAPPAPYLQPRWAGQPLEGRTILLTVEQGLGDTIQFIRFAPLVKRHGARVLLECPAESHALLSTAPGIDRLVLADAGEHIDYTCPLMSLPAALGLTQIPADIPYLAIESERGERWQRDLSGEESFKVGFAWAGSPTYVDDASRSIPIRYFAPLADCRGVKLFSLQQRAGHEQLAAWADRPAIVDLGPSLDAAGTFVDTAAVMKQLDLVISCDTSIVHLAGALGVPVWGALPNYSDWRWIAGRQDSPWYPSLRLFRQSQPGDWAGVFARMAEELRPLASGSRTVDRNG